MTRILPFILLAASFLLAGCNNGALFIESRLPEEADRFSRTFITHISTGEIDAAFVLMNKEVRDEATRKAIEDAVGTLAKTGKIVKIELIKFINSKAYLTKKNKRTYLRYQIEMDKGYVHATALVHNTGPDFMISGFFLEPLPSHLAEYNTFEFKGKSVGAYVMLLLAVVVPLFILYSLYLCLTVKGVPQRYKWFIFIFFGFTSFVFNWTNGLWGFQLLTLHVVGATVLRDGIYGPWMLTVYVPVGAILFHRKLRHMRRDELAEQ
ncbi:MAG: hypothetical protein IME99_04570 [Proteobacteria bacterium]|nr:hypothetical protein [Pseudomonadota bacterium]